MTWHFLVEKFEFEDLHTRLFRSESKRIKDDRKGGKKPTESLVPDQNVNWQIRGFPFASESARLESRSCCLPFVNSTQRQVRIATATLSCDCVIEK